MVNDIYPTNNCGDALVLSVSGRKATVKFLDTGTVTDVLKGNLIRGEVKDRNKPTVVGVGYIGYGKYDKRCKTEHLKAYMCWHNMLIRCYDSSYHKSSPTYYECSVVDEWHNFQNFAEWYYDNYPKDGSSYQLDKDKLVNGNKIYSPETCVFLTHAENAIIAGQRDYEILSPSGELVKIKNMTKFCKGKGLDPSTMCKVANGTYYKPEYKGWRNKDAH